MVCIVYFLPKPVALTWFAFYVNKHGYILDITGYAIQGCNGVGRGGRRSPLFPG